MERKIGDTFEHKGKKLIVEESNSGSCDGCFFNGQCPLIVRKTAGECQAESRVDNKYVIFVEVKEHQETEAVKERKIGEKFDYYGKTLEVVQTKSDTCYQCCFKEETGRCSQIKTKTGVCDTIKRSDRRPVIFMEVKKQSQKESKATKERKIGEVFDYEGKKLRVEEFKSGCDGCFFDGQCRKCKKEITGSCGSSIREDGKNVIFVDVQPQEDTEKPKERKVGEVFEYEGRKLKVMEETDGCTGCYFREYSCHNHRIIGECLYSKRSNNKGVIFIDITDESTNNPQPQEEPQKLNLCEILKNCPMGEPFWSPLYGDVKLYCIDQEEEKVVVTAVGNVHRNINSDGTATIYGVTSPEVMLYPSREQRDWSKVKYEKKNVLPKSWEEFCVTHDITMSEYFIGETGNIFNSNSGKRIPDISKTILPSEQAAEAHLAYMQLHQLRNAWREGWEPDWTDNTQAKFAIIYNKDEHIVFDCRFISRFLTFQDEARAKEFLECYKGLIKKAGDLI